MPHIEGIGKYWNMFLTKLGVLCLLQVGLEEMGSRGRSRGRGRELKLRHRCRR